MAFHSKAWTASTVNRVDGITIKLTAQLDTGKKAGLLERLQKEFPFWKVYTVSLYRSRPFHKSFFKCGIAIKATEIK